MDLLERGDLRRRDIVFDRPGREVVDRARHGGVDEQLRHRADVRHSRHHVGEPRIVGDLGNPERRAQPAELRVGDRRCRGEPVGQSGDRVVGGDRRRPHHVVVEQCGVHRGVGPHEGDRRVEHRELDVLAGGPARGPREQCRGDRLRGGVRGRLVADECPVERRLAGRRVALHARQAGGGLDHVVVHPSAAVRPVLSVAGDRGVDEVGIDRLHVVVAEPESVHRSGPEVLDEHVGVLDELADEVGSGGLLEVDDDRAFPAVVVREDAGHPALVGAEESHDVAESGRLDLDDVGSLVGEHHRGERPGDHHREVQYLHAVEWSAEPCVRH